MFYIYSWSFIFIMHIFANTYKLLISSFDNHFFSNDEIKDTCGGKQLSYSAIVVWCKCFLFSKIHFFYNSLFKKWGILLQKQFKDKIWNVFIDVQKSNSFIEIQSFSLSNFPKTFMLSKIIFLLTTSGYSKICQVSSFIPLRFLMQIFNMMVLNIV